MIMREDKETTINAECKAEAELWDIQHEGYFGVQDTIKLIDDIKVEMFDRGVKYAKRWRKVSEELPPMSTEILLRLVDGSHQIGYYLPHKYRDDNFYNHCESDIEFLLLDVVEWKPID